MRKKDIKELRKFIIDELTIYSGDVITLDMFDDKTLDDLIFKYKKQVIEIDGKQKEIVKKTFALPPYALMKIDFSNVSFDNFDISSFNKYEMLKGIKINPQTVYDKNLSAREYKGITFIGSFNDVKIENANFKGSFGAVINPQTVHNKNLKFTNFEDTKIIGSFDECILGSTKFKGAMGKIKINPQTIYQNHLSNCVFDGVEFIGSFDGAIINAADFTGSIGVVINPQTVFRKDLSKVKFANVIFDGSFRSCIIYKTDFTGSIGAVINPQTVWNKKMRNCIFCDVEFVGLFNGCNIEYSDFTGSDGAIIIVDLLQEKSIKGVNLCDTIVYMNPYSDDEPKFMGANMITKLDEATQIEETHPVKRKILNKISELSSK